MSTQNPPFAQSHRVLLPEYCRSLVYTAAFPWSVDSFNSLWAGELTQTDSFPEWRRMIEQYSHLAAVTDGQQLWLVSVDRMDFYPIQLKLSQVQMQPSTDPDYVNSGGIAWALHSKDNVTEPLVVVAVHSILFVVSVVSQSIVGIHRGHGGSITSVVVHPNAPHIFATTSRDMTTRLFDLQKSVESDIINKNDGRWPSQTGAPHGLRAFEREGVGMGCCFCVLVGGRSGGHNAAVLHAAFHPIHPIIATCGVDRACKIWRYRYESDSALAREDKPLFSTTGIHKARVLNISWIGEDCLLSHSSIALMRSEDTTESFKIDDKSGTVVLWKWLGLRRYFPPFLAHDQEQQRYLRGCFSDYDESESWQFISAQYIPTPSWAEKEDRFFKSGHLYLHASPSRTPLMVYTPIVAHSIHLFRPEHLKEHKLYMPNFSAQVSQEREQDALNSPEHLLGEVGGWEIPIAGEQGVPMMIRSCAVTRDGRNIIAVGTYNSRGCFWVLKKL